MVPKAAVRGAAAAIFIDARDGGDGGSVRTGRQRRQVRDAALPVHVCERQGEEERPVLLARVENLGRRRYPVGLAEVQTPPHPHLPLLHPPSPSPLPLLVPWGRQAAPLHCPLNLPQAQPRRFWPLINYLSLLFLYKLYMSIYIY